MQLCNSSSSSFSAIQAGLPHSSSIPVSLPWTKVWRALSQHSPSCCYIMDGFPCQGGYFNTYKESSCMCVV